MNLVVIESGEVCGAKDALKVEGDCEILISRKQPVTSGLQPNSDLSISVHCEKQPWKIGIQEGGSWISMFELNAREQVNIDIGSKKAFMLRLESVKCIKITGHSEFFVWVKRLRDPYDTPLVTF